MGAQLHWGYVREILKGSHNKALWPWVLLETKSWDTHPVNLLSKADTGFYKAQTNQDDSVLHLVSSEKGHALFFFLLHWPIEGRKFFHIDTLRLLLKPISSSLVQSDEEQLVATVSKNLS